MTDIKFSAMPTEDAMKFWAGGEDAYGMKPETQISDGEGVPCRHCLQDVGKDEPFLILAYKPFAEDQPYAETGPIFLHAKSCQRHAETDQTPESFKKRPSYLMKGYYANDRIVYGTGRNVEPTGIEAYAKELFSSNPDIAYIHVRSTLNNCYSTRIDRA